MTMTYVVESRRREAPVKRGLLCCGFCPPHHIRFMHRIIRHTIGPLRNTPCRPEKHTSRTTRRHAAKGAQSLRQSSSPFVSSPVSSLVSRHRPHRQTQSAKKDCPLLSNRPLFYSHPKNSSDIPFLHPFIYHLWDGG
jgi:hypothetical protein